MIALVAVVVAALMAIGLSSIAAAYPPDDVVLDVSERVLPPSTSFVATVSGCTPGEMVTFSLVGNDSITVVCDGTGTATAILVSPPTPGRYDVTAILENGTILTVSITVTGDIPRTGTDATSSTLLAGGGLVLFGTAFLVVARLRRRDQPTAVA